MAGIFTLLLNVLIVALLAITIAYCWILNRRIKVLQDSRGELAQLLKHFDASTQRASESIIALQTASKKIGENIQLRIEKANYLLDDLTYMIDKGNKLANQMEAGFAVNRAHQRVISEQPPLKGESKMDQAEPVMEPEVEMAPGALKARMQEKAQSSREKTSATLEAVLGRVVGRNNLPPAAEAAEAPRPAQRGQQPPPRARSRAEQELLDMIKAGIKG